jgi:hypothetical protein
MKRKNLSLEWLASLLSPLFLSVHPYIHGQVGEVHPRLLDETWLRIELQSRGVKLSKDAYEKFDRHTRKLNSNDPKKLRAGLKKLKAMRHSKVRGACLLNNIGWGLIQASKSASLRKGPLKGMSQSFLMNQAKSCLEKANKRAASLESSMADNYWNHISRTIRANLNDANLAQRQS